MDPAPSVTPRRPARTSSWHSRLALLTSASLGFLAASGAAVWLLPFSRWLQIGVLVHTAIGLLVTAPIVWYTVRHWREYRAYPLTAVKLLGYLGVAMLALSAVSGLVLTWQPLFGTRIDYTWRAVHRWTMVGLAMFGVGHVLLIIVRDWRLRAASVRTYVAWTSGGTWAPFALMAAAAAIVGPPTLQRAFPADYERWRPTNALYKENTAFAPSLARTVDGEPIDPALLAGSDHCGTSGCHTQIVEEWQPSAHRYAAMDKAFQAIQLTMARQNGPTSTRYCGGCHDPISLFSGTKNISADESALTGLDGYREGISCLSCHAIRQTDVRGNAQYAVQAPVRYIGEIEFDRTSRPAWRIVRDFLIRAYPAQHVATLSKTMFKKPEYCAACHKQFVDEEVNKVGWVQLQNQFDNWRMSHWARNRSDPARTVECRECHMPLVASTDPAAGDSADYNRTDRDGRHRSHRFLGANQLMPELLRLPGAAEQTRLIDEWLKGRIAVPEIADKWQPPTVPAVSLDLVTPASIRAGEQVTLKCVITSRKVGHDYPTGPLDMIQSWVEIVVRDGHGATVFQSGTVDANGFIEPGSFLFKSEPVDQYGNLIDRHNLWEMVGVRNRRSLFPGSADTAEFAFRCPATVSGRRTEAPTTREFSFQAPEGGNLSVSARLRYRKVDQFLLNYMRSVGYFPEFRGRALSAPITDLDTRRAELRVEGL